MRWASFSPYSPPRVIRLVAPIGVLAFEGETDLDCNLVMTNLAILDVSPSLDYFEPIHVSDGLTGLRDRSTNCFLDTRFRRTNDFEHFVDVIFHFILAADKKTGPPERAVKYLFD
jgi:hypothetical protein